VDVIYQGKEVTFEGAFKSKGAAYEGVPGFVGFYLLRRDADKADDGYNYMSTSIWNSRQSFENWKSQTGLIGQSAHCPQCVSTSSEIAVKSSPAYFEGKLTILGEKS